MTQPQTSTASSANRPPPPAPTSGAPAPAATAQQTQQFNTTLNGNGAGTSLRQAQQFDTTLNGNGAGTSSLSSTGGPAANTNTNTGATEAEKNDLYLDLVQTGLDVAGIFEPTPFADAGSGIISAFRGDWGGALISAAGVLPYVGDLAKAGKLPKLLRIVDKATDIAKADPGFAKRAEPLLEKLHEGLKKFDLDDLPGFVKEPLEKIKTKLDDYFSPDFRGTLRGADVDLPGVKTRSVDYVKRDRDSYDELRKAFDSTERKAFAKDLAGDPAKRQALVDAGLTDSDIARLADGKLPPGWQVHHKLPIDDGGTNSFDNLVLIKNEPSHKVITNAQRELVGDLAPGQSRTVDFPVPEGFIYPPRPGMVQSPPR